MSSKHRARVKYNEKLRSKRKARHRRMLRRKAESDRKSVRRYHPSLRNDRHTRRTRLRKTKVPFVMMRKHVWPCCFRYGLALSCWCDVFGFEVDIVRELTEIVHSNDWVTLRALSRDETPAIDYGLQKDFNRIHHKGLYYAVRPVSALTTCKAPFVGVYGAFNAVQLRKFSECTWNVTLPDFYADSRIPDLPDAIEHTEDAYHGCTTSEGHRAHYDSILSSFLDEDTASIVVSFIVPHDNYLSSLGSGELVDISAPWTNWWWWHSTPGAGWNPGLIIDQRVKNGEDEKLVRTLGCRPTPSWNTETWVNVNCGKIRPYGWKTGAPLAAKFGLLAAWTPVAEVLHVGDYVSHSSTREWFCYWKRREYDHFRTTDFLSHVEGRVLLVSEKAIVVSMEKFGIIYILPWDYNADAQHPGFYRSFFVVPEATNWTCPKCQKFSQTALLFCPRCGYMQDY